MIRLSTVFDAFADALLERHGDALSCDQRRALQSIRTCRSALSSQMQAQCPDCLHTIRAPHSCGHRLCPHCQHHESEQWLRRQLARLVPAPTFLVTFTLPGELRPLAHRHPRVVFDALMRCAWETLREFAANDRRLQGTPGAIAVLHTHSRRLDFHPHVHLVVPAGVLDRKRRLWRHKGGGKAKPYLFNHKALAKVFRGKLLDQLRQAGLVAVKAAKKWVVNVKHVGDGHKALTYLGRYLYRGVIAERDILRCENGEVTFRYRDARTKAYKTRTLSGVDFLRLLLRHVLPKGMRRARNYGFLHPNSKPLIALLQWLFGIDIKAMLSNLKPRPGLQCPDCGATMQIIATRLPPLSQCKPTPTPPPTTDAPM
jgi:hypothetical protein